MAAASDPEHSRRRAVWTAAKGRNNKEIAQAWLCDWREGGFDPQFPELGDWLAAKRLSGWETHFERMRRLDAESFGK